MRRFETFYKINIVIGVLWFLVCVLILGYALAISGWWFAVVPLMVIIAALFYISGFYSKKRFAWLLEKKNKNLRERLISLVELQGINHGSIKRLEEEVSRERMVFRPFVNAPMLISFGIALLTLLATHVKPGEKPYIKFFPGYLEIFEGDSVVISTEPAVERVYVSGVGEMEGENGRFVFKNLPSGNYRLHAKGYRGTATINVLPKPLLYGVEGYIVPPKYTGLSPRKISPRNVAYEGSTFDGMKIKHNGDSAKFLNLPKYIKQNVKVYVRVFKMGKSFDYEAFEVEVIKDMPPSVSMNPSGIYKAEDDKVKVFITSFDDIGLSDAGFKLLRNGKWSKNRVNFPYRAPNLSFGVVFNVDDTLKVVAYAVDVAGKVGVSDTLILLPKSPMENLKEKLMSLDRIESLEKRLKDIEERIKASNKISEYTKQEISSTTKSISDVYRDIKESLERFARELDDPEISTLINDIRMLMREVFEKDIMEELQRLNKAMEKVSPEEIEKALEKLRISQRKLKEDLERFLKLLKRYEQEKRFEELADKLVKLSERQQEIFGRRDTLSQKSISRGIDSVMKALEEYRNIEDIDREKLDSLMGELSSAKSLSDEAVENIRSGKGFKGEQARVSLKLLGASDIAENIYNSLVQKRTGGIVQELNNISDASAFISKRISENADEDLLERAKMAVLQMRDKLKELSEKNVFVSPRLKDLADSVYKDLNEAQSLLAAGRWKDAEKYLEGARDKLTRLSENTSASASACQNAGGSTGMSQFIRQLMRMAGEQGAISQNLMQGLTPEELAELAARQMALNQALGGLIENMRNRGMPGDVMKQLERTLKEMKDLEEELNDPQSIKRIRTLREKAKELKIRLLQARNALRKQRTEPVYEAERPKPYKVENLNVPPVVDRRVILEIYRKVMTNESLSLWEKEVYKRFIKKFLE